MAPRRKAPAQPTKRSPRKSAAAAAAQPSPTLPIATDDEPDRSPTPPPKRGRGRPPKAAAAVATPPAARAPPAARRNRGRQIVALPEPEPESESESEPEAEHLPEVRNNRIVESDEEQEDGMNEEHGESTDGEEGMEVGENGEDDDEEVEGEEEEDGDDDDDDDELNNDDEVVNEQQRLVDKHFPIEEMYIRNGIKEVMKRVFFNITLNLPPEVTKLDNIYDELHRRGLSRDIFRSELEIRLTEIFDKIAGGQHRTRVLKVICDFSAKISDTLYSRDADVRNGDDFGVRFLVEYIAYWAHCEEAPRRANICLLIGVLFESLCARRLSVMELEAQSFPTCYDFLISALRDQEYIRVEAIKAISKIQHIPFPADFRDISPTQALIDAFRDVSWMCRLAAVENFNSPAAAIPEIRERIFNEKNQKVRLAAIKKFGLCPINPEADLAVKLDTVYRLLNDSDTLIRSSCKIDIIEKWVTHFAGLIVATNERQEEDIQIIQDGGDLIRPELPGDIVHKGYSSGLVCLMAMFYNNVSARTMEQYRLFAKTALNSIHRMYAPDMDIENFAKDSCADTAVGNVHFLHRDLFELIFVADPTDVDTYRLRQKAGQAKLWEYILEYIDERKKVDEYDKRKAFNKFLPHMTKMIEILKQAIQYFENLEGIFSENPNLTRKDHVLIYVDLMSIILTVLKSFKYITKEFGTNEWRDVLFDMIFNIYYNKAITDQIVIYLIEFYDDPDDFFKEVFGEIEKMEVNAKPGKNLRAGTTFIGISNPDDVDIGPKGSEEDIKKAIRRLKLRILNSALKTGKCKELGPSVYRPFHKLVDEAFDDKNMDSQVVAMECVGCVGLFETTTADGYVPHLFDCFDENDVFHTPQFSTLLTIITDWSITQGVDVVQKKINGIKNPKQGITWTIQGCLAEILMHEDPEIRNSEVALKAAECITKLLINIPVQTPTDTFFQDLIFAVMSRMNYKIDDIMAINIRSMCTVALTFFSQLSSINQMVFIEVFEKYFIFWTRDPDCQALSGHPAHAMERLQRMVAMFAALTKKSMLQGNASKDKSVQYKLAMKACNTLLEFEEEREDLHKWYMEVLHHIEFDTIGEIELRKLHERLQEVIGITDDGVKKPFRSISNKLDKAIQPYRTYDERADLKQQTTSRKAAATRRDPSKPSTSTHVEMDEATNGRARRNAIEELSRNLTELATSPSNENVEKRGRRGQASSSTPAVRNQPARRGRSAKNN